MGKLLSSVTIVVDPGGKGHVRTLAQAVAALPAAGGTISLSPGDHAVAAQINLPRSVKIVGVPNITYHITTPTVYASKGSRIVPASGITLFAMGGLGANETRTVVLEDLAIVGDGTQTMFNSLGATNYLYLTRCAVNGFLYALRGGSELRVHGYQTIFENPAGYAENKFLWRGPGLENASRFFLYQCSIMRCWLCDTSIAALPAIDWAEKTFINMQGSLAPPGGYQGVSLFVGFETAIYCARTDGTYYPLNLSTGGPGRAVSCIFYANPPLVFNGPGYWADCTFFTPTGAIDGQVSGIKNTFLGCKLGRWQEIFGGDENRYIGCTYASSATFSSTAIIDNEQARAFSSDRAVDAALDRTILMDASGGPRLVTLPGPATCRHRNYAVKKTDASANPVTVATVAGTIDGAATVVLSSPYQCLSILSDGANWHVVSLGQAVALNGTATAVASVSADTPLNLSHGSVLVDASGGGRTITLPNANLCRGRMYVVKKTDASANAVTLASGGGTIDGEAAQVIRQQNVALMVQSDGTNWRVI